jgi:glycosyltransferase involved in cell wall biosynthesis
MKQNKVLFIGLIWPEPKSSAAGKRILQLMDLFLLEKFKVFFATTAKKSKYSELNASVYSFQIEINSSSFDNLIKEINPDVVVFDRFLSEEKFSWRVKENCPNSFILLDTEDLHFLRFSRQQALKENRKFVEDDLYNDYTLREIASILRSDLSLIISEYEFSLLVNKFHIAKNSLVYLPFLVDSIPEKNLSYSERSDFAFIGNYYHEPNIDAVLHLKNNIWPIIHKKNKSLQVNIYGAYMPQIILNLDNKNEGFNVIGRIDDANEVFSYSRVFLAPLRFGAGQKGKLLEALMFNLPSIVSTVAVESMNGIYDWCGFIENEDEKFADLAIEVYSNQILWEKLSHNSHKILKNKFDMHKFKSDFFLKFYTIFKNLNKHRKSIFISQIINYETLNSKKYFSLWIEEKNKKR